MPTLWKPAVFQGSLKKKGYFEGWYFKLINSDESRALALIPGVSLTSDGKDSHAFIMILDARAHHMDYIPFPLEDFQASKDKFEVKIGDNLFSSRGVELNLKNINASIKFGDLSPWPVKLYSPGVMGPFAFIPFMECYHGVISMDHSLSGYLQLGDEKIDFTQGKGYLEKDWGSSMPSSWIWMQTNHFKEDKTSLFGSVAIIPWLRNYFTGFIFGFLYKGKLYQFTAYNRSKVQRLDVNQENIAITITRQDLTLKISARRSKGVDLPAPSVGEMSSRVNESLNSTIQLQLLKDKELLFEGEGTSAGLEFVGDLEELLKGFKK